MQNNKVKNKNKNPIYLISVQELNKKYKVLNAKRLTPINQYKRRWLKTDARTVARNLNRQGLIIK